MKTIKKSFLKSIPKFAFLAILLLAFSCGPDAVLESETSLEAVSAKSQKGENSVLKVIARGAELHGTNGIYFGPDDNLYIASFYGQNVTVMNKQNGKILKQFGVSDGVLGPDDLVFHPDGQSFYFTDIISNFVGRMSLDGTLLGYQEVAPGVNPITFLEVDGEAPRLFVGLDFQGDGLYELDPNLVEAPRAIVEYAPDNYPIGFLNAFDFGPDGFLYGPVFTQGFVVKVDVGEPGDLPSSDPYNDGTITVVSAGFTYPVAAKFGPDGLLTVLDQTGEVFKVNTTTGEKTLFTTLEPGLDNLAFDKDGTLYVSNADFGWIVQILPSGKSRTISRGGMIGPMGVAVLQGSDKKDDVFVGDLFRMRQFNGRTGKEEKVYKGYLVAEPDKLTMPFAVQADGENLLVTSWFGEVVQVWSPKTDKFIKEYSMVFPIDAVRVNGQVVVSDLGLGGVVMAEGYSLIAPLNEASGLATDGVTLWAADWLTGEIWQIDFDGVNAETPFLVASGLSNPEGLAFEKEGSLVVVETGTSTLSRIDLSKNPGNNVTTIAKNLELSAPGLGAPNTWWFDGVAVGPSGDIYVAGGGANVLYRVSQKKGENDDDHNDDHGRSRGRGRGHGH
jgi:sugar lactone lactonase YvrE